MTINICKNNIKCLKLYNISEIIIKSDITHSDLEYLVSNYNLDSIKSLCIAFNNNLTSILLLPNLTKLSCYNCNKLTSISILPELTYLSCYECTYLKTIPTLPKLTYLYCEGCTNLSSIQNLPNLTKLDFIHCYNLLLYTVPLNFISKSKLTTELINSAVEYNNNNIEYLESLDKSDLSDELITTIDQIITSSVLVKPSNFKY